MGGACNTNREKRKKSATERTPQFGKLIKTKPSKIIFFLNLE
jgi:hypothetical protein